MVLVFSLEFRTILLHETKLIYYIMNIKIEKRIIDAQADLRECNSRLNKSIARLWAMRDDLGVIPYNLNDINTKWVDSVSHAKNDKALRCVAEVSAVLREWPTVQWVIVDDDAVPPVYAPTAESFKAATEAMAATEVPPEAEEHARLIAALVEFAKELRNWETERDVRHLPAKFMATMGRQQIFEMWAEGRAKMSRRWSHIGITQRIYNELF